MSSYNKNFFLGVWPFLQIKAKGYGRIKNAPNQKTDATLKNQLFKFYNFALNTQDDLCTLNALKMHLVFGSGVSAPV